MYKTIIVSLLVLAVLFWIFRDKEPVSASAETLIQAPLDKVWDIQTNLKYWQNWNKDIESMEVRGDVGPGTEFVWKAGGITIESRIKEYVPKQKIAWQGKTFGIKAYHVWTFTQTPEGVKVYTQEEFTGLLAWLLPGTMRGQISKALTHGVEVLKAVSEQG